MNRKVLVKVCMLLLVIFVATACSSTSWKDGIYEGSGKGMYGEILLNVEINDGKITSINVVSHNESASITDKAFENIPMYITEKQSTEVDTISGATITSMAIIEAVNDALEKAK